MPENPSKTELGYIPAGPKRKTGPNMSGAWIAMLLSGLIAAVVFIALTNQSTSKIEVLAAAEEIRPGDTIDSSSFKKAEINAEDSTLNKLILFSDKDSFIGHISTNSYATGELVVKNSLTAPATSDNKRAISIPTSKQRAVAGLLIVGDRIDIISPDISVYDLQIIHVREPESGSLAGSDEYAIVVSVTPNEALNIDKILITSGGDQKYDIVRSTGAKEKPTSSSSNNSSSSTTSSSSSSSSTSTTTQNEG